MVELYNVVSGKEILDVIEERASNGRPYLNIQGNYIPLIYVEGKLPKTLTEDGKGGINYSVKSNGHEIVIPSDIALPENSPILERILESNRIENHYVPISSYSRKKDGKTSTDYAVLLHLYVKQTFKGKEEKGIVVLGGHTYDFGDIKALKVIKYMGIFEDKVVLTPHGIVRIDKEKFLPEFYHSIPRHFKEDNAQKNAAFQDLEDAVLSGELEETILRTRIAEEKGMNPLL